MICKHCSNERTHRARGLCGPCWRRHRDEYPVWLRGVDAPTVCVCSVPAVVPVGGPWGALGAKVCDRCQRPPEWSLRAP